MAMNDQKKTAKLYNSEEKKKCLIKPEECR